MSSNTQQTIRQRIRRKLCSWLAVAVLLTAWLVPTDSFACCLICPDCTCVAIPHDILRTTVISPEHGTTRLHFDIEMLRHQEWLDDVLLEQHILPAMMRMTEQLTAVGMHQILGIGMLLDAKHQLETQLIFQDLVTQAHKDYHPSMGMCKFGTNVRSLAAADRNADLTAFALSQRSQDRQSGNVNVNAGVGPKEDREGRLEQFKEYFCDVNDNNRLGADTGFTLICNPAPGAATINRDIDFTRFIAQTRTLDMDLSDGTLTEDERAVFALASNLYSHDVFPRLSKNVLTVYETQQRYLDLRSVMAKRSVVENSFNAIAAMKTSGTDISEDTAEFMQVILIDLGMSPAEAKEILGKRPSYLAQLEILAKKIYQSPDFYVNLYDKPVNVRRKIVAMQAIGLMLDRDIYNSYVRSEALMSVLLELRLIKKQEAVQNLMKKMKPEESAR
ncbi:MAG: hypothetical protein H6868_04215 [Rhodospirillales bacterium]|nr:hypothetical protein [Rhodospirillales bacterium]